MNKTPMHSSEKKLLYGLLAVGAVICIGLMIYAYFK